jgi:protoheme IX farnesyltransferase
MLPVVKGVQVTARAIRHYALATVAFSLLGIWALPTGGLLYGLLVVPMDARLLQLTGRLSQQADDPQRARALFRWSILYLFGVSFLLLLARTPQASALGPELLGALRMVSPLLGLPTLEAWF